MLVTERNFGAAMERLRKFKRLFVDTETNGLHTWHGARQIGISVKGMGDAMKGFYFPFRHQEGTNLSPNRMKQLIALLGERLQSCWNGKFDTHMLQADGQPDRGTRRTHDVMLLMHLLDENQHKTGGSYELKIAAEKYIDPRARQAQLKLTERLADLGLDKGDMDKLAPEEVEEYAVDDVYYTEKLEQLFEPAAREWDLRDMWDDVSEYSMVTQRMEERGFLIDVGLCKSYINECKRHKNRLQGVMDQMVGSELNIRSYKQIQKWLDLPSSAEDYLEEVWWRLTDEQKAGVKAIQEYRKWDRAQGSYYEAFIENVDRQGAYHPNVKLHGTISGRPSSSGTPNTFALPRYTEIYKVKDVIKARPGYVLVSADYSQMELRFGAHYSGDEYLIKCFQEGKSPHKLMMSDLTGQGVEIDYDDTKRVNFAIMYGTGAPTLSKELKKPIEFARDVLKKAHALHPNYKPMLRQAEDTAREFGFIRLWSGRVRRFTTLPDPQPWYHKACSNLIQGGVGEVMRIAICRLSEWLPQWDAHMLLQVYDQILFEVPTKLVKQLVPRIVEDMTKGFPFSVPFAVEVKVGKSWGQLKEMK